MKKFLALIFLLPALAWGQAAPGVGGPGVSASSSSGSANALSSGTISGTTSVTGPFVYAVDTITLVANAGPMNVAYPWSYVTFAANTTLTPSAYGSVNTTHVLHANNSGAASYTVTIANSGTNYTLTVPAGSDAWYTLVSNGSNAWVPLAGDPASASVATTSRVQLQNPTTGVYFYDTVANEFALYVNDAIGYVGTFAAPDTTAAPSALTLTHKTTVVYTSAAAAVRTYQLPAAASYAGYSVQLVVVAGTNHVNVKPAAGAQLNLQGTLLTADHYAQDTTSAAKDRIFCDCDGTNWNVGFSAAPTGTWADAASP